MTFKIILVNNPESTKEPIQLYGGVSLLLPVRRDNHNRPRSAVLSGREKAGHQPGLALLVQINPYLCLFLPLAALIQVFSLVGQRLGYIVSTPSTIRMVRPSRSSRDASGRRSPPVPSSVFTGESAQASPATAASRRLVR